MILWTIAFTPEDSVYEVPPVALECDNYVAHLSRYRVRQGLRMATVDEGVKWVDIRWVWLLFSLLDHCSIELFSLSLRSRECVWKCLCGKTLDYFLGFCIWGKHWERAVSIGNIKDPSTYPMTAGKYGCFTSSPTIFFFRNSILGFFFLRSLIIEVLFLGSFHRECR